MAHRLSIGLAIGFWVGLAGAAAAQDTSPLLGCKLTPATTGVSYPGEKAIIPSSRLARPNGKAEFAPGMLLYLTGRITDRNCVPLQGAIVDIWQADASGNTRYLTPRDIAAASRPFSGTGRILTDNLGRYAFLTIYPGPAKKEAAHVHFRVKHKDVGTFFTQMYFAGDPSNSSDKRYMKLKPASREAITAEVKGAGTQGAPLQVEFNITLPGKATFKKF